MEREGWSAWPRRCRFRFCSAFWIPIWHDFPSARPQDLASRSPRHTGFLVADSFSFRSSGNVLILLSLFTFIFTVFSPEGVFWALLMSPSRHRGPHVLRGGDRPTWGPHHLFPIRQGPPSLPDRCPGSRAPWLTACHTGHLPVRRPPCRPSVPCPRRSPRHVCCRPYL